MSYNDFLRGKDVEKTLIDEAENIDARRKQVRETIINSVKACSDEGRPCDKKLLIQEFRNQGFPVSEEFILNCLEDVKLNRIKESEGMLWLMS